ncbi:hypothetical protein MNB_SM-6-1301 [hydrothermal vent metagenome]|uniref:Uncharacterized protein n=1 Tax=hydrothermal vent metagenome TaxID=652676 RepID=A0A1W1CFY9_9ZZZZ
MCNIVLILAKQFIKTAVFTFANKSFKRNSRKNDEIKKKSIDLIRQKSV